MHSIYNTEVERIRLADDTNEAMCKNRILLGEEDKGHENY